MREGGREGGAERGGSEEEVRKQGRMGPKICPVQRGAHIRQGLVMDRVRDYSDQLNPVPSPQVAVRALENDKVIMFEIILSQL